MLKQLTTLAVGAAILFPTSAAAFRPSPDQVLYSYSLPDGTPVCVVMNHNNSRSEPDGRGGWRFVPDPQPIALDCRNGKVIVEEHVPVPRPEPAPEPEVSEEERRREQCKQIREGAREGAMEAHGGGIPVLEAEMIAVFACAIFL